MAFAQASVDASVIASMNEAKTVAAAPAAITVAR
jgi:hypothetical protein